MDDIKSIAVLLDHINSLVKRYLLINIEYRRDLVLEYKEKGKDEQAAIELDNADKILDVIKLIEKKDD